MPNRVPRGLVIASLAVAASALVLAVAGRGGPAAVAQEPAAKAGPTPGWSTAESCRLCHRADAGKGQPVTDFVKLNEVDSWEANDKHHDGFKSLQGDLGKAMGAKLGWADVSTEAKCLSCHAPAAASGSKDAAAIAEGVSCVSCHGAFSEWVAAHGGVGNRAKQEAWIDTPAAVKRDRFGMTDLRDPAVRSEVCASCHIGDKAQGRVVTHEMYAAGHPPLPGLEVSTFSEAEPPHWWAMKDVPYLNLKPSALMKKYGVQQYEAQKPRFEKLREQYHVDEFPTQHAKLVAVGGAVTLREAMELFADTGEGGGTPDFARFDCASCHHDLRVSADSFRQKRGFVADPGRPPAADWPAALASIAIEAGDPSQKKGRTAELADGLKRFHEAVGRVPFGDPKLAVAEARAFARWADAIAKEVDARKLTRDDAVRILKQITAIEPPDHASARQLAWSFRTVYHELDPKPPNDAEIAATVKQLIDSLGIKLLPGNAPGTIEREVGARLDADERFHPEDVARLFDRLAALLK